MKKRLLLALIACLSACSQSAQGTLDKFLQARQQGQHEMVYALHASQDQAATPKEAYLQEQSNPMAGLAQAAASQMQYKVLSVEETGEQATAQVETEMPDYSKLMGDMMGDLFKTAFSGDKKNPEQSQKEMADKLAERIKKSGDLPRIKRTETVLLVKENGQWKVNENWQGQKRIGGLRSEAGALEDKNDWQGAKAKYEEILSLKPDYQPALEKLALMNKKLEVQAARKAYFPMLELKEIRIEKRDSYIQRTYLKGKVRNTGDRTLMHVQFTVYYLDGEGKPIFEESHFPVITTDPKDQDELLKPGYIEEFTYEVDRAPSEWKGKVKVELSDLKFVDEPDVKASLF